VDPLTALTVAYGAIKTGVKVGKDIQSLASDIGSLWDSIDQIRESATKAKGKNKKSINQEATDLFLAEAKAIEIENELREFFTYEYTGPLSWPDMIRIRNQVRKQRQEERLAEIKKKKAIKKNILIGVTLTGSVIFVIAVIFFFISFLSSFKN